LKEAHDGIVLGIVMIKGFVVELGPENVKEIPSCDRGTLI